MHGMNSQSVTQIMFTFTKFSMFVALQISMTDDLHVYVDSRGFVTYSFVLGRYLTSINS
jgi:hypothetical protein